MNIATTKKKTLWITNNAPNIRKESKRVNKDLLLKMPKTQNI